MNDSLLLASGSPEAHPGSVEDSRDSFPEQAGSERPGLAERMRAVAVAAAGLIEARSHEALRTVLEAACRKVIPFDAFFVQAYDAASHTLHDIGGSLAWAPAPPTDATMQQVLGEGRSLLVHRAEAAPEDASTGGGRRFESVIYSPILSGEDVLGLLSVHSYTPGQYAATDVEVVEVIASLAATALLNVRLAEERQAAETALQEREHQLNEAQRLAHLGSWAWTIGSSRVDWSDEMFRIYGLPRQEGGIDFADFVAGVHPADRALLLNAVENARTTGQPFRVLHRIVQPDGAIRVLECRGDVARNDEQEPAQIFGTGQDITELNEAEALLRASEESYRTIFELASDAIFVHDVETGAILDANHRACELHGCTLDELKALGIAGISDGSGLFDGAHAQALIRRAAGGEPQRFEWKVRRKTGERFWVEVSLHRVRMLGEDRILASVRSIDERKQAEAALQHAHDALEARVAERTAELAERTVELAQAEQRFRAIVEASPTPLLLSGLDDGVVLYANDRLETLVGVAPGSLAGLRTPDFYYDPADRPAVIQAVREQGYVRDLELRIKRADGTPRWVSLSVQRLDFDGVPALATSLLDITERKQSEEALRQRTHELEAIFRALPDLYFRMEADGTIRDYRAGRSFGLYVPAEAFLGRRVQHVLPPPVGTQVGAALAEVAQTHDLVHFEYKLPLGEERRDFEARLLPLPDGQVIAVVRDVTARKQAEEALHASEASYRGLVDNLTELVYIQDLEGRFLHVNEAVLRAYGYAREEIIGRTPDFLGAPGTVDPEAFAATFGRALAGEPQRFEWWGLRKDGSIFPKEVVIKRTTYFGQDVVLAVARDISERVEAEAALRRSEEHFRRLIENVTDLISVMDPQGVIRYQSPAIVPILGYAPEEMLGRNAFEFVAPEDVAPTQARWQRVIEAPGTPVTAEFRFRHKDGSWRYIESIGTTLSPESPSEGVVINSRDITERKRAEATLRLQKTLLEAQGEASIDGFLVVSEDGRVLSYNQRLCEMWSLEPAVLASGSRERVAQAIYDKVLDPAAYFERANFLYAHPEELARDEITLRDGRVFDRYSAPVVSHEGDYYGRIWFFRDITAQKQHARELEQARQDAERSRVEASHYARSLERELEFGRKIQQGLLPAALPQLPGWEIAVRFRPVWQVAGDFYDAFELPSGHVGLIIADVSGKGVGAALFMALFQSLLRASAERASATHSPSDDAILMEAVTSTNDYITRVHRHAHMFASVFFGVLDPASGTLHYVNAGHEPPVLLRAAGTGSRLRSTGPALGLLAEAPFEVARTTLAPGDALLAFTDGVTEARDPARDFFTEERLMALLAAPAPTAAALLDRIEQAVHGFTGDATPSDDLTLLAVRRNA